MKCKIEKVLNNNVILVDNYYGNKAILIGSGLGFKIHPGTNFSDFEKINQIFVLTNEKNKANFDTLTNNVDNKLIAIIEEEIDLIQKKLQLNLSENIHVSLIDHIAFAIDRYNKGLNFNNPFTNDLAILYDSEYELASKLVERINKEFNANLDSEEIGLIAIHIHAAICNEKIEISRRKTVLIQELIVKIYQEFNMEINQSIIICLSPFAYPYKIFH